MSYEELKELSAYWWDMECPSCGLHVEMQCSDPYWVSNSVACPDCKVFMDYNRQ